MQSFTHDGTVTVEEGADAVGTEPPERDDGYAPDGDDDSLPGFGITAAAGVVIVLALAATRLGFGPRITKTR